MDSDENEASEANDLVLASGGASAACVVNGLGSASGSRVPGEPSNGQWDPIPILVIQPLTIQGSIDAVIDCPKCSEQNRNISCIGAKQLNEHMMEQHPQIEVAWQCDQCEKSFSKIHAWRCHYPKCKGKTVNPLATFNCTSCEASFESKIGLSQHERHAHPKLRNAKRAAEAEQPAARGGRKLTVWSAEELERLEQLNEQYRDERNINIRLMEFFPGKTNKQISDARRRFKPPVAQASVPQPDAVPRQVDIPEAEAAAAEPLQDEASSQETSSCGNWREAICAQINTEYALPNKWAALAAKLVMLAKEGTTSDDINLICEELVKKLADEVKPQAKEVKKRFRSRNSKARPPNRLARRRYAFAKCQELMNNCPKKLADAVAANDLSLIQMRQLPETADIKELYTNLWGTPGPQQEPACCTDAEISVERVFLPITPKEVQLKIRHIASSSAAGLDGIGKANLKGKGISSVLARLFNLLLLKETYPQAWKLNRTTLIPKAGKDPLDARNWRPITISSMIGRVFSSLLDRRIRDAIQQTPRQKGFTKENGCFANTRLLSAAIGEAKIAGGVLTVLDISKAFDTVPHQAIHRGLVRKGIPAAVANYVTEMYNGCKTVIKTKDNHVPVELKRGVKQGDPLSPMLFNLVIEPIIQKVQEDFSGIKVEGSNLAAIAFADDLVLLAKDRETAIGQINMVYNELRKRGMSLSIEKCFAFQYVPRSKTWYIKNPEIVVRGTPIQYGEPDKAFRYLGAAATPWKGLIEGFEIDTIQGVIDRVKALPIKPMQKLTLLRTYLLPRYTYGLVMRPPSKETLKNIDTLIRSGVKKILHLHETTNNVFMYTPLKEGGLGLQELLPMVYLAALRNAAKAALSDDIVVRNVICNEGSIRQYKTYAAALRLPWPATLEQIDNRKKQIKQSYRAEWAQLIAQGQGVDDFAQDPLGNAWLTRSNLLKSSRLIDALKLRTNTYPTRMVMSRAYENVITVCRACGEADETLGHILGKCMSTKAKRINRHNEIVNLLKDRLAVTNRVMVEPTIKHRSERFKPDLVVWNKDRVLVLDITVRYENKNFLAEAAREKIDKYKEISAKLKKDLQVRNERVVPIVVGSRGALPAATTSELKQLNIRKSDWLTISLIALRSSIEIANAFMDS